MNNRIINELTQKAYKDYTDHFAGYEDVPSIDWFISESKTNQKFSERWGLSINERDLTIDERWNLLKEKVGDDAFKQMVNGIVPFGGGLSEYLQAFKIPKKSIEINYKGETFKI